MKPYVLICIFNMVYPTFTYLWLRENREGKKTGEKKKRQERHFNKIIRNRTFFALIIEQRDKKETKRTKIKV